MGGNEGWSAMRAPLQLSLLISPIYLLLPFQIAKKSFNRQHVINTCASLGNQKPQLLLDVERSVWNTLFSLASGKFEPLQLLLCLSKNLPWELINHAGNERSWFKLGKRFNSQVLHILLIDQASLNHMLQPATPTTVLPTARDAALDMQDVPSEQDDRRDNGTECEASGYGQNDEDVIADAGHTEVHIEQRAFDDRGMKLQTADKEREWVEPSSYGREYEGVSSGEDTNSSDNMKGGIGDHGTEDNDVGISDGVSDKGIAMEIRPPTVRKIQTAPSLKRQRPHSLQRTSPSKNSRMQRRKTVAGSNACSVEDDEIPHIFNSGRHSHPIECSPWEPVTVREFVSSHCISCFELDIYLIGPSQRNFFQAGQTPAQGPM
jgi:hypothetical protein